MRFNLSFIVGGSSPAPATHAMDNPVLAASVEAGRDFPARTGYWVQVPIQPLSAYQLIDVDREPIKLAIEHDVADEQRGASATWPACPWCQSRMVGTGDEEPTNGREEKSC